MLPFASSVLFVTLQVLFITSNVTGHGRLMDPPSRNAMWRYGFPNAVNYNDNELFCGGFAVQWEQNGGNCGVCGDPYQMKEPRPHEAGGEYAKGIISRFYSAGQEIDVEVELTANHYGRFEMYLCPNNDPSLEATQECFDKYPLMLSGTREHRYYIPSEAKKKGVFKYRVRLPRYVTCTQCVLQWTYYTGNMWGKCANGTEAVGCGRPETFRNCADIAITSNTGGVPPLFVGKQNPFLLYYKDLRAPEDSNVFPLVVRDQTCVASRAYSIIPGIRKWCQDNCLRYPPNCPESVCNCPSTCDAIGELEGVDGADVYCQDACIKFNARCPTRKCRCY